MVVAAATGPSHPSMAWLVEAAGREGLQLEGGRESEAAWDKGRACRWEWVQ